MHHTTLLTRISALAGTLVLAGAATAGPAWAGDRTTADARERRAAQMTEDDDTNDRNTPNNVVDDGDNRHPSGKDRSVERGRTGTQGRSASDPDDDGRGPDRSNGGADRPDGPGGVDLADQDGNNGCGNDDDFEDDNEGWCGRNPKRANAAAAADAEVKAHDTATTAGGEVLSSTAERMAAEAYVAAAAPELAAEGEVLSASATAAQPATGSDEEGEVLAASATAPSGTLPVTGATLAGLLVAALAAIGAGSGLTAAARRRR